MGFLPDSDTEFVHFEIYDDVVRVFGDYDENDKNLIAGHRPLDRDQGRQEVFKIIAGMAEDLFRKDQFDEAIQLKKLVSQLRKESYEKVGDASTVIFSKRALVELIQYFTGPGAEYLPELNPER